MATMPDEWYREEAVRLFKNRPPTPAIAVVPDGHLDRGTGPPAPGLFREPVPQVSHGDTPGAWVMLWGWVPDPPGGD